MGLDAINEESSEEQKSSSEEGVEDDKREMDKNSIGQRGYNLLSLLSRFISKVLSIIFNNDILHIIRPFIYIFLVMKHGKSSWRPIAFSFAIDVLTWFLIFLKLIGAQKLRTIERRDLRNRVKISMLKYLLRDPIFEQYTLVYLKAIFIRFRIPAALFGLLKSVLNFYRYYIYIA